MILHTRAEVGYRAPKPGLRPAGNTNEIVHHWVGSPNMPSNPTLDHSMATLRAIQSSEMDHKGYNDISYGYAVDPSGNAFEARTLQWQDGASNQENSHSVSIVYMAGPGTPLTQAAKQTLTELVQWLKTQKPGIARNVSHRDIRPEPTACPGDEVAAFVPTIPLVPAPVGDGDLTPAEHAQLGNIEAIAQATRTEQGQQGAALDAKLNTIIGLLQQLVAKP